ncbi:hypothetical protein GGR22_003224 [Flavobacterium gossypii]|uniref:Uncharacterized protein n=1 Tax=Flavobacterium gossypii TaxID=1646119 RepID=A0ABR6DTN9_9FLAO|nr:hypothetical protein [Flavobacterium gossypii]MBA9075047.1 hypothetical protein [Flavobacterium gossypii]
MKKEIIKVHQDQDDLQKFFINRDVDRWNDEVAIIEEEIVLFSNLLGIKNDKLYSNIMERMNEFKLYNLAFQEELIAYDRKLEVLKECEDLQCETFFLNSHNEFKEKIEAHFYQYRNFKKTVFSVINNK